MSKFKVSVFIVTYNHEHYIKEAIESVLMQKTDFEFNLVIGEDCSRDNTRSILLDYQKRYPGKFTLLLNEQNIGIAKNWIQTIQACTGTYIAMLEGDDYWTDPEKLQKQVNFLEANPDFSMCFHNAMVVYDGLGNQQSHLMTSTTKDEFTLDDITQGWNIHTATVMFRNGLIKEFPEWCRDCVFLDLPLFVLLGQLGRVKFLDEVMSVYRKNAGSQVFHKDYEMINLGLIRMHDHINRHLHYKLNRNLINKISDELYSIAINKYREGYLKDSSVYLWKSIFRQICVLKWPEKYKIYLALQIHFPGLLKFGNIAVKAKRNKKFTTLKR